MASAFTKPLVEITRKDVREIVSEHPQEGNDLEFKQALPTEDEKPDRWETKGDRIGDYARNKLLAEVIGFANAHGGHMVLGIVETKDKPARADKVTPVDRCIELAERFLQQINHCIEPKLPMIGVRGVKTLKSRGVVIFRVPQSRLAPHRSNQDKECYVRRNDRCEKMTMREIQDLTLARSQGADAVDARFEARHRWLSETVRREGQFSHDYQFIRVTLIPIGADFFVTPIFGVDELTPSSGSIQLTQDSGFEVVLPGLSFRRRVLRGVRYEGALSDRDTIPGNHRLVTGELYSDGFVEYLQRQEGAPSADVLQVRDVLGLAIHAMITADRIRRYARFPEAEYALEIEVARTRDRSLRSLHGLGSGYFIEPLPLRLPRYSVGPRDEFGTVLELAYTDTLNAGGESERPLPPFDPQLPAF